MPSLREYAAKRRFDHTPEPKGGAKLRKDGATLRKRGAKLRKRGAPARLFVVQKHRATQLHYDFRLEHAGVLLSWAVPKGPSPDPAVKRLAMRVEDHPLDYARFEGVIPAGEYGGGTVMVWDIGTWVPDDGEDAARALRAGRMRFSLRGRKLRGAWALVRTRGRQWLLMKSRDRHASTDDLTLTRPRSVLTRRLLAGIARDAGGDVETAATADPAERQPAQRARRPRAPKAPRRVRSSR